MKAFAALAWQRTVALTGVLWANARTVTAVASLLALAVSTLLMWYSFAATLDATREIAQVTLARELSADYFGNEKFSSIEVAIADCLPLSKDNGGAFTWKEINDFLGFFDDVGFYYRRGALDYDTVDQRFAGNITGAGVTPRHQVLAAPQRTAH